MNSTWHTFLRDRHAIFDNDRILHFGNIAAERKSAQDEVIIADLSSLGLIRFFGDDAEDFLQKQLTCDVRAVNPKMAQYGAYCTAKGRVYSTFTLWQQDDSYMMQLPANLITSIQKRLSMYVLRAKVQLTNVSDEWVQIGLAGVTAAAVVEKISNTQFVYERALQIIVCDNIRILCLSPHRFVLISPLEKAPELWRCLSEHAAEVGTNYWEWLTIQDGIPVILPETQELFIPQMINLDALGGVSFKKGCYPGQEIVARTHYLGQLKRRMILAHIDTAESVKPGDLLYSEDMTDQSSGMIVNAVSAPQGGVDVLAVIQQDSMENYDIHLHSLAGAALVMKPLPYALHSSA